MMISRSREITFVEWGNPTHGKVGWCGENFLSLGRTNEWSETWLC